MWWLLFALVHAQVSAQHPESSVEVAAAPSTSGDPDISFLPRDVANDEAAFSGLEVVAPGARTSIDLVLWVRKDGNYFLHDKLIIDTDFARVLGEEMRQHGELRLLISADEHAPYGRITNAVNRARDVGVARVAVEVMGVKTGEQDPLFTAANLDGAIDLTGESRAMTAAEISALRPKLRKFPQNPYTHTDFTAYTLERGETRLGLANVSHGITPRLQFSTTPLLDVVGVWNLTGKANLIRSGRFDGALITGAYFVPVSEVLNNLGVTNYLSPTGRKKDAPELESSLTYFQFGVRGSLRLADKWSAHLGTSYGRVNAQGRLSLGRIPAVEIPKVGKIGGTKIDVVPQVIGELMQVSFATDYRFNRRDSLIFQFSAPTYVAARGIFQAESKSLPKDLRNLHATVGYDQWLNITDFYAASIAWQFSWRNTDLRVGLPILQPDNPLWFFQAFNLSYQWGGETRRGERELRRGYRENKKQLGTGQ